MINPLININCIRKTKSESKIYFISLTNKNILIWMDFDKFPPCHPADGGYSTTLSPAPCYTEAYLLRQG